MGLCLLHSMNSVNISCYSYWARCRVKCVCKPQLLSAQICLPKPHIHLAAEFNSWIYWNENWMQCHFFYVNFQRQSSLGARVMKTYRKLFCRRLNGDNMQPWELQKFILHVTDSSLRFYPLRSLLLTLIFFVILLRLSAQSSHFLSLSPLIASMLPLPFSLKIPAWNGSARLCTHLHSCSQPHLLLLTTTRWPFTKTGGLPLFPCNSLSLFFPQTAPSDNPSFS